MHFAKQFGDAGPANLHVRTSDLLLQIRRLSTDLANLFALWFLALREDNRRKGRKDGQRV